MSVCVTVDCAGEGVAWIAGHIVWEKEKDLRVWDTESFHSTVQGEGIA